MQSYDAVVIGAGHNGLTCAAYLARAGLRVLVAERNAAIGGMTSTRELVLPGYRTDTHASGYQLAGLSSAAAELGLAGHGLELIRPEVSLAKVFADNRCLGIMARIEDTCASLAQFSARDADTWRTLFRDYLAARDALRRELESPPPTPAAAAARIESLPDGQARLRLRAQPVRAWAAETFESEAMRGLMADFAAHAGFAPDDAGGAAFALLFLSVIQDVGNRAVKGGMGRLPDALAACLAEAGGAIRTAAPVAQICADGGRATGVRLADGSAIAAGCVVSSVHPCHLVLELLAEAGLDPELTREMEHYELGTSQMGIHLALSGPATYAAGRAAAEATQVHVMPATTDGVAEAFCAVRAGRLAAEPPVFIVNEAAVDPGRVPDGRSSLKIILTAVPYGIDWGAERTRYAAAVVRRIAEAHIPDLEEKVVGTAVFSPVDYEADVASALHGTVTHGALVSYQEGAMRPTLRLGQYRGPLRGLYLCGAGSHPGPGVSMMPGRNAAKVVLADLGRG